MGRGLDSVLEGFSPHQVRMVLELLTRLASAGAPLTTMGSQNNVNINEVNNVNNVNNDVNICNNGNTNSVSPNFNNAFDVSPSFIGRLSVDEKDIEAKPEEAHNREKTVGGHLSELGGTSSWRKALQSTME